MSEFAAMASRYDELRPAWRDVADEALGELRGARRLLDVGCGTGRFASLARERLGARVWGVDPSPEMLAQAQLRGGKGCGWKLAGAESLPFKDGWFDAVHAHLVLHLVDSLPGAVAEMLRVLSADGRVVVVSFRPEHFDRFHLAPYFPSLTAIDRRRFPAVGAIEHQLRGGGMQVAERAIRRRARMAPEQVLERVRGRYILTLHLLDEDEYQRGLRRLERDLAGSAEPIETELVWSMIVARRPGTSEQTPQRDLTAS
jgi:ubiquinone/menaquinone biosynthesis C-methylase UbiE